MPTINRRQWLQRSAALAAGALTATASQVPGALAQSTPSTAVSNPVGAAIAKPLEGDILASGLLFPEGPIAMPDGSVVVVELAADRLTRIDAQGQKTTIAQLPGGPNGAAVGPDGHFYICLSGGLEWKTENGHTFSTGPAKN